MLAIDITHARRHRLHDCEINIHFFLKWAAFEENHRVMSLYCDFYYRIITKKLPNKQIYPVAANSNRSVPDSAAQQSNPETFEPHSLPAKATCFFSGTRQRNTKWTLICIKTLNIKEKNLLLSLIFCAFRYSFSSSFFLRCYAKFTRYPKWNVNSSMHTSFCAYIFE